MKLYQNTHKKKETKPCFWHRYGMINEFPTKQRKKKKRQIMADQRMNQNERTKQTELLNGKKGS